MGLFSKKPDSSGMQDSLSKLDCTPLSDLPHNQPPSFSKEELNKRMFLFDKNIFSKLLNGSNESLENQPIENYDAPLHRKFYKKKENQDRLNKLLSDLSFYVSDCIPDSTLDSGSDFKPDSAPDDYLCLTPEEWDSYCDDLKKDLISHISSQDSIEFPEDIDVILLERAVDLATFPVAYRGRCKQCLNQKTCEVYNQ